MIANKENGHSCPLDFIHHGLNPQKEHGLKNPCPSPTSKAPTERQYTSPGQRPGSTPPMNPGALKGRNIGGAA